MSSVIERLQKRRRYPIEIDGETVFIRSLKQAERDACEQFKNEESSLGYAIGIALMADNGEPMFTQSADEPAIDFGDRVLTTLDMADDTRSQLVNAILKLSNGPTAEQLEALKKN